MNVIDGRMRVLVVGQMHILHGQHGQFVRTHWVATLLHVPSDLEQMVGRQHVIGGIDDDLIGNFEGIGIVLAQVQRVQCAVGRIFAGALKGQAASTGGQFVLLLLKIKTDKK